ncbi:MAG: hypothetical protein AB7D96_09445 [Arcobacteraceae bacterium]
MIHKINRYMYWFALTLLITGAGVLISDNKELSHMAMLFLLSLAVCTFLNVLFDILFKFQAPSYFQYHEDIFYDTQWTWEWNINKEILNLKPTCPACHSELFYHFDTLLHQTEFVCEKCNKQIANVNSSHRNFVVESVKKSIIRKLKKEDSSF